MKTTSNDYRNDFPNDEFQLHKSLSIFSHITEDNEAEDNYRDDWTDDWYSFREEISDQEPVEVEDKHTADEWWERFLEETPHSIEDCF